MKYEFDDPTLYANLSVAYHYKEDIKNRDKYYALAEKNGYTKTEKLKKIFSGEVNIPVINKKKK